jgi:hypothetical protein
MHIQYRDVFLIILVLVLCQTLFGCLVIGPPINHPFQTIMEDVYELEDKYDLIVLGKTDRKIVIDILGEPIIFSRNLKFDVFRRTARRYGIALFPGVAGYAWSKIYVYTLVTYNEHNVVDEIDHTRYYTGDGFFYSYFVRNNPWDEYNYLNELSQIDTKNIKLIITGEGKYESIILYNSSSLSEYIKNEASKKLCIIITGCEGECAESAIIDGKEILLWPNSLFMSEESSGEKRIDISSSVCSKSQSMDFTCKDGDIFYFTAKCQTDIQGNTDLVIEKNYKIPDEYINGPVLIWRDGTWLIDNH